MEEVAGVKIGILSIFSITSRKTIGTGRSLSPDFTRKGISDQDNALLISPFCEEEIKEVLWSCESARSPESDGFNFEFFKEFWHAI